MTKSKSTSDNGGGDRVTITVPTEKLSTQLRVRMEAGRTPEQAAGDVLSAYEPAPVTEHLHSVLVREARSIQYKSERAHERNIVFKDHHGGLTSSERQRISVATFRDGEGNRIEWGRATASQHQARIQWDRTRRDLLDRDIERHQAAIKLIESENVECLDDITDWHERIGEICENWIDDPVEREALEDADLDESDDKDT